MQASSCKDKRHRSALMRTKLEIIFAHTYPRLDIEVSKKMNHLLKAPFCVHPKTGKVCIPIDPETAWDFDVEAVPTVWQLITELNDSKRLNVNKVKACFAAALPFSHHSCM